MVHALSNPPTDGTSRGSDDWFMRLDRCRRELEDRSPEEHSALQQRRAERLLRHHAHRSRNDGYRRLLERCYGPAEDFRSRDWSSLPIIDKSFLPQCAYAERPAVNGRVLITETSGSTSSAVAVPHTPLSVRLGLGDNFLRALLIGGVEAHHRHWGIEHRLGPGHLTGSHLSFDRLRAVLPRRVLITETRESINSQIEAGERWQPDCISSAPGFLLRLAMAVGAAGRLHPRFVLYGGAALEPAAKRTIARALNPQRFVAFYPTTDAGALGVSPTDDGVYRCFSETHLIEVVDADGRHVDEGEDGDLVVTTLDNLAAPLIRYRIGDRVRYLGVEANRVHVSSIKRQAEAPLGASLLSIAELTDWTPRLQRLEPSIVGVQLVRRREGSGRDRPVIRIAGSRVPQEVRSRALDLLADFPQVRHEIASGEIAPPEVEVCTPERALRGQWKLPAYVDEADPERGRSPATGAGQ